MHHFLSKLSSFPRVVIKAWIENGASIIDDEDLRKQLVSMCYGYSNKMQIQLWNKKEIKKLGLSSPDVPDAISMTFAGEIFQAFGVRQAPRKIKPARVLWA